MSPIDKLGDEVAVAILTVHISEVSIRFGCETATRRARKQFCDCPTSAGRIWDDAFETRNNKKINPEVHKNFMHFVACLTLRASIIPRRDCLLYLSCDYYSRKDVNNEGTFSSVNILYR
jgi:hypothetical protein